MEKLNHLTSEGLFQPELSHDPETICLSHPAKLSPKYNADLKSFFLDTSHKPACSFLCHTFLYCKYGSKPIFFSAHSFGKGWILKEDNGFDEEIQKHKTDK